MNRTKTFAAVSLCFAAAFGAVHAEPVAVSGATTIQKRVLEPGADALKAATGVELKIYGPGTGKGMLALFEGKVPVGAAGESLQDAIESARSSAAQSGKTINVPANLVYHEVASDNIVLVVHESNPVRALTKRQATDIHTGKIRNWKEVGGANLPIKLVTAGPGQAVRNAVQKYMMDGAEFSKDRADIRTALEQLKVIGGDPAAVGAMSESVIRSSNEKIKPVAGAGVPRPLGFVTVGQPQGDAKKMIDFFQSPEGRKVIR